MSLIKRTVRVQQLPRMITPAIASLFLSELCAHAETERPRFVIDCSEIRDLNVETMSLLLSCLEEAMKLNGDVRLAGLNPHAEGVLRHAGLGRIFETFADTEGAVQSFQRLTSMAPVTTQVRHMRRASDRAA